MNSFPQDWLEAARRGDGQTREALINQGRNFIAAVAARVCGRYLDWREDDELSIALIAFNEAIDRYDPALGVPFTAHARTFIRSRLTDYFRQELRHLGHLSLEADSRADTPRQVDRRLAEAQVAARDLALERAEEIREFDELLVHYGMSLKDLKEHAPRHRDTRERLRGIARTLARSPELSRHLLRTRQLPLRRLQEITGASRKVLEEGRRFIVGLALLLIHSEFELLRGYAGFTAVSPERGGGHG